MLAGKSIKYLLFDAANTLIHKPVLWDKILAVLDRHNIHVPKETLIYHHKLLSEFIDFPDRTSKDFYLKFNHELLLSLGIEPNEQLLDEIFTACTYLDWERFEDTHFLADVNLPIGVLSNFNNNLTSLLNGLFGDIFSNIIVSEDVKARKPDTVFYEHAIQLIGLAPEEILYVGDSVKLDIIPANKLGLNTLLIDRPGIFKASARNIRLLSEIPNIIN